MSAIGETSGIVGNVRWTRRTIAQNQATAKADREAFAQFLSVKDRPPKVSATMPSLQHSDSVIAVSSMKPEVGGEVNSYITESDVKKMIDDAIVKQGLPAMVAQSRSGPANHADQIIGIAAAFGYPAMGLELSRQPDMTPHKAADVLARHQFRAFEHSAVMHGLTEDDFVKSAVSNFQLPEMQGEDEITVRAKRDYQEQLPTMLANGITEEAYVRTARTIYPQLVLG